MSNIQRKALQAIGRSGAGTIAGHFLKLGIRISRLHIRLGLKTLRRLGLLVFFGHAFLEAFDALGDIAQDRKSTRLNSSHSCANRTPSSARQKKNSSNAQK